MFRNSIAFCTLFILLMSCEIDGQKEQNQGNVQLSVGNWKGVLKTQGVELPFLFEVMENSGSYSMVLKNAEERIPLNEVTIIGDSIKVPLYIFDASFTGKITPKTISGYWTKDYLDDYKVEFEAEFTDEPRFGAPEQTTHTDFSGKWEVDFIEKDTVEKAIGIFKQEGTYLSGTFVLSTGDYRFLEGSVSGNSMKISCFDGTHAYLFHAEMAENSVIHGEFWSGKTWHQTWTAKKNADFELPDPYALTYLKDGVDIFKFAFPNTEGQMVSLADEAYVGKPIVVQLLGSWCPNCMDETRFFVDWLEQNPDTQIEFIGLGFERKADFDYASKRIKNMKKKLGIPYEVLIAGSTAQESREQALPMLNKIMSFPTTIVLDKEHKVRKIHTGFAGPGTGSYYNRYVEDFNLLMEKLETE